MTQQIVIWSYFSFPTDLAEEMHDWPEFVRGQGYSVDLLDAETGGEVTVRYIEEDENCSVVISADSKSRLFDRVVGRVVCGLSEHSDNVMVQNRGVRTKSVK